MPHPHPQPHPRMGLSTNSADAHPKNNRPTVSRGPVCVWETTKLIARKRRLAPPQVKTERAARQQGSSLLRENSSNGGKTIRTFWLHTRGAGWECQEEFEEEINVYISIT
jgi:hypothetical protein